MNKLYVYKRNTGWGNYAGITCSLCARVRALSSEQYAECKGITSPGGAPCEVLFVCADCVARSGYNSPERRGHYKAYKFGIFLSSAQFNTLTDMADIDLIIAEAVADRLEGKEDK